MPMIAIAMPPAAGPTIAPPWLTLLRIDTPRAASLRGTTWASSAVRAGRSKPLATPVTKITARMPASDSEPAAERPAKRMAQPVTIALARTTIVRRSRRSARWPPKRTRDRAGIASTRPSQPSASGSRVISYVWKATTVASALTASAFVERAPRRARNSASPSSEPARSFWRRRDGWSLIRRWYATRPIGRPAGLAGGGSGGRRVLGRVRNGDRLRLGRLQRTLAVELDEHRAAAAWSLLIGGEANLAGEHLAGPRRAMEDSVGRAVPGLHQDPGGPLLAAVVVLPRVDRAAADRRLVEGDL